MKHLSFALLFLFCATLPGCAAFQSKEQPIPRRGTVVAEGAGQLSFRAPAAGLVSIYDRNVNSIIHSTGVTPGSVVTLDPATGKVLVTDANAAGVQVVYTAINKSHRYELWFIPYGAAGAAALPTTQRWTR